MMDKIMLTGENTMKANDAVNRIMNIVGEKPLKEPDVPKKPSEYSVEFKNVTFSYYPEQGAEAAGKEGAEKPEPALKQVSLFVPQGRRRRWVGASGAGKTTLASLIPQVFDADGRKCHHRRY